MHCFTANATVYMHRDTAIDCFPSVALHCFMIIVLHDELSSVIHARRLTVLLFVDFYIGPIVMGWWQIFKSQFSDIRREVSRYRFRFVS
jgi:hypothetical protein